MTAWADFEPVVAADREARWPQQRRDWSAPAQLLRALLVARLVWTPRREAAGVFYDYAGRAAYGRLLTGFVGVKGMVPPG